MNPSQCSPPPNLLAAIRVATDRGPMAAVIVGAINQETANAGGAHLSEGDLLAGEFGRGETIFRGGL
jgi:hypothetical protein